MKTSMRIKTIAGIFLFVTVVGISVTAHAAEWMSSHGNVSQIEYPVNCSYFVYKGWGLDLSLKSSSFNWIHMTVPSPGSDPYGAKNIRLIFYTGSTDAWVSDVHVYNGDRKVHEFKNLSYSSGWKDIVLTLPSKMTFKRGLGISILIKAGVEPMNHRFIFSTASAYFY